MDALILICKVVGVMFNTLVIAAWVVAMGCILVDIYFNIRYR